MVDKQTIQDVLGLSDEEVAKGICMGLAVLIRTHAGPDAILEFLTSFVNTIRLAEAERVPVRVEGAN